MNIYFPRPNCSNEFFLRGTKNTFLLSWATFCSFPALFFSNFNKILNLFREKKDFIEIHDGQPSFCPPPPSTAATPLYAVKLLLWELYTINKRGRDSIINNSVTEINLMFILSHTKRFKDFSYN